MKKNYDLQTTVNSKLKFFKPYPRILNPNSKSVCTVDCYCSACGDVLPGAPSRPYNPYPAPTFLLSPPLFLLPPPHPYLLLFPHHINSPQPFSFYFLFFCVFTQFSSQSIFYLSIFSAQFSATYDLISRPLRKISTSWPPNHPLHLRYLVSHLCHKVPQWLPVFSQNLTSILVGQQYVAGEREIMKRLRTNESYDERNNQMKIHAQWRVTHDRHVAQKGKRCYRNFHPGCSLNAPCCTKSFSH